MAAVGEVVEGTSAAVAGQLAARAGLVERTRLSRELRVRADVPVVLVVGGAGYGKTTLVSQWLRDDARSVAWLTATSQHDDPAVLLADIVRVLDEFEPLEPRAKQRLSAISIDFSSVLVPRLERTVAERARPFVLVIDDAHRLRARAVWSLLQALADCVPHGSQLVLVSRLEPPLAAGRMRADRRLHVVGASALAMDRDEAGALLDASGSSLPGPVVDRLWQRTEGWPVGLYLASLAIADADDPAAAADDFAGDDRIVVGYVREELLGVLLRRTRDFLMRASILEELRPSVCDAVLERDDSAKVLAELGSTFPLLIPLDRRGEAFRLHQLLRDTLQAELVRTDPVLARELHVRAARWYEEHGDFDQAVDHLHSTDDPAELERVIWRGAPIYGGIGRTATVARWLSRFGTEQVHDRPALAASSAWIALMAGDMSSLRHWADVVNSIGDGTLPDGDPVAKQAALLRALIGAHGIEAMRADAARAYDLDLGGSPFRAIARYLEGGALRLQGRRIEARDRLLEGEAIGSVLLPATQAHCLAQLAALAIDDDDWETARNYVERLSGVLDRYDLRERPAQAVSLAVCALVLARSGDDTTARVDAKQSLFLVSMLSTVAPWISIETRIELARAFLLLGDVVLARTLVREAFELLVLVPDGDVFRARLAELERSMESNGTAPVGVLATAMTPAEMRVLRYLPTHLTFAAIAEELYVSRNTIKTQAISIYRKLGVSSRGPAVDAARGLGLLDDVV